MDLHGKRVETSVYHCHGACDELGSIAHQVVYGATEFFRLAHTSKWGLTYYIFAAFCIGAVGIGEK